MTSSTSISKLAQLIDEFALKVSQFEALFAQFAALSQLLSDRLIASSQRLNFFKRQLSEWFVCYLAIYDEFFSLYVGNIWLPRHTSPSEQIRYQHHRKGRDHADVYKGAVWMSKCSIDGIQYEANQLRVDDERIENRINQLPPQMDSYPPQFNRITQLVTTKLRQISVKDSLRASFEHQREKLEMRSVLSPCRPLTSLSLSLFRTHSKS
jgi:hypothetical protein